MSFESATAEMSSAAEAGSGREKDLETCAEEGLDILTDNVTTPGPAPSLLSDDVVAHVAMYKNNDINWLIRREAKQAVKIREQNMHAHYDSRSGQMIDLGMIRNSWAFVFHMARPDDGKDADDINPQYKHMYDPQDKIPLECWQLAHRLWKQDFQISHSFSTTGEYIILSAGLPYQLQIDEAKAMKINMRLSLTKGSHGFIEELVPRYPRSASSNTCFNSSHRQGLCLARMKRKCKIYPELMTIVTSKTQAFKAVRSLVKHEKKVRGRVLYKMFDAMGCYRPHAEEIFGSTIKHLSQIVLDDEWIIFYPPDETPATASILTHIREEAEHVSLGWQQVVDSVHVIEEWMKGPGQYERFNGEFAKFFPLHQKEVLAELKENWGNYGKIFQWWDYGYEPEESSLYCLNHPLNTKTKQFSMLYQPIDEVRDVSWPSGRAALSTYLRPTALTLYFRLHSTLETTLPCTLHGWDCTRARWCFLLFWEFSV
eukprot:COSAG05_NODE_2864_length_2557_cov_1.388527_1_plen_484_part_00